MAFFGLCALLGYPLINITKSKILLVFFYPLNACANPYLYALMTAPYRHDLYLMVAKLVLHLYKTDLINFYLVSGRYRCGFCKTKARKYSTRERTNNRPLPLLPKDDVTSTPLVQQCCNNNCQNGGGGNTANTYV